MSVLSEMIKSDKKRVGFDLWVGGLAWYDSWFQASALDNQCRTIHL